VIIVVGDHGESLGEHGETEHGFFIYQATTRIPFIIRGPEVSGKAKRVKNVVSLVDIVPTILSYLDIEIPDHIQGEDLSAYSQKVPQRRVYFESVIPTKYTGNPLLGLNNNRYEYIKTNRPELYDLVGDRSGKNNLVEKESHSAQLMDGQLQEFSVKLAADKEIDSIAGLDEKTLKRLESLGYVGDSSVSSVVEFDESRKDPKDLIEYYEQAVKLMYLKYDKKYVAARAVGEKMLVKWPEIPNTLFMMTRLAFEEGSMADTMKYGERYLGKVLVKVDLSLEPTALSPIKAIAKTHDLMALAAFKLEKYDLAIKHWGKALEIKADWPEVHNNLALAFYRQGKTDEAIKHWAEALRLRPDWTEVRSKLDKLTRRKEQEEAVAEYIEMLQRNPDDPDTHDKLATTFYLQGNVEQAIKHWTEVVRLKPDWAEPHNSLATAFYRQGNVEHAIKHWTKAVDLRPDWAEAYNNLAWLLATVEDQKLRNPAEAVRLAERACELTEYKQPGMLDTLGVVYAAEGRFSEAVKAAEKGIELARQAGDEKMIEDIVGRLELYKINKPYRN
jgi:tetratricopeptide (TPR) repeat protein